MHFIVMVSFKYIKFLCLEGAEERKPKKILQFI